MRILVVDDFAEWRSYVAEVLGPEIDLKIISTAADGVEAVKNAETFQPDLVLLDVNLPGMNGFEAAKRIRALSAASKIVFLSEAGNYELVRAAFEAGGSGYVLKSDSIGDLVPAIRAALEGRQFVSRSLRDLSID